MQNVHAFSFVIFFVTFDSTLEATAQSVGSWQQCLGSSYFICADTRNNYESKTYCQNMLRPSYLANFTLAHAKDIITSCTHLNMSKTIYWLGQQVGKCRVFYKKGSDVVVYLQPCTNNAHALCEMSSMPAKPVGLPSHVTVVDSSWQACNGKCYLFGAGNVTFSAVNSYCRSMSKNSQPVTFGSKLEGSVTTDLSTCRLKTVDGHTYWINKHSVQNRTDPDCRTATFSGTAVYFKTAPCLSSSKPFCETSNTRFCKTSNKTDGIAKDWVSVSGQRPSYKVSSGIFGYCEGQNHCKASLKAQIARKGNYTFMGLLAAELGIKGQQKLDFWLHSPGILCPSSLDNGSVMRYTGPLVHMVESMNATEKHRVLCEKNTTVATVLPLPPSVRKHTSPRTAEKTMQTRTRSTPTTQTTTQTSIPSTTTSKTTTQTNTLSTITSKTTTQTNTPSTTTSQTTTQTTHSMDQTGLTDACLSYIVKNMTMTTLPCHFKKFSVCSRILDGDISKVLKDPGFRKMIREMTVLRNETKKIIRKLTCAEDRRTSARAASGVGVFIVCSVVTLLLISDCSGIKSDFFNRKKKAQ